MHSIVSAKLSLFVTLFPGIGDLICLYSFLELNLWLIIFLKSHLRYYVVHKVTASELAFDSQVVLILIDQCALKCAFQIGIWWYLLALLLVFFIFFFKILEAL